MKRDDTKENFTSLSGNDLQTVRLHYPSFPCIIAIVLISKLFNLMRYSSVLNANIRFFCSENRNFLSKKYFLSMLAMAAMLLSVSCSKDDVDAYKNATVSFDITTSELVTRAYGDGTKALHLMYAVYDETAGSTVVTGVSKLEPGSETEFTNLKATVNLSLLSGNEYSILFWATGADFTKAYTINWDSKTVTMNDAISGNTETFDSFFHYEPTFKVSGSINKPITLVRPFAQLNIGTNDKDKAIAANLDVTDTKVVVKSVPKTLDVTTGEVYNEQNITYNYGTVPTEDVNNKFPVDGYSYLAMNYVLVGTDKIFSDIELSYKGSGKEFTNIYPSIPLQRNHRTNVYGSILTNSADYEVKIEDKFDGSYDEQLPEYNKIADGVMQPKDDVNTYIISGTEGFEWVAANVAKYSGFENKTIKLANDINLFKGYMDDGDPVTTAPIGDKDKAAFKGVFDGQGHSIKNLYQNGWALNYEWGVYGSLGLFRKLENATVKNLVIKSMNALVEGGDISFIAGSATGTCVFEDITIENSSIGTYNNGCGGIIGWSGEGEYTFKNIKLGSDVVLGGLWGSFDSSIGGIVGQAEPGATYNFENVKINCRIDAYNDCTASYDYYNYRMCGMIIGRCAETTTIDGANYPDLSKYNLSFNDVVVNYGDWMNYHYCRKSGERAVRVESGYAYGGIADDRDHSTDDVHCMECIPFNQLIGGDQFGVKGLPAVEGVTVNYPESYFRKIGYKAEGDKYTVYSGNGFYKVAINVLNDGSKNVTIELANDIDLKDIKWPAVCTKAEFTLDGKGYSIKNLNTSAIEDHGFYSTAMFTSTRKATTIKNVVVENAVVTGKGGDNSHGAVLVACNYADLTIESVTVKNSTVSNCDRSSVIATYLYFTSATVKDCVVEGCTVNSIGTAGALLGVNNSHNFEATGNTVKNTTISSSEGSNKAGILIGTWQTAGTLTQSNNVVENSKAINAGTETNCNIGREVHNQ